MSWMEFRVWISTFVSGNLAIMVLESDTLSHYLRCQSSKSEIRFTIANNGGVVFSKILPISLYLITPDTLWYGMCTVSVSTVVHLRLCVLYSSFYHVCCPSVHPHFTHDPAGMYQQQEVCMFYIGSK